MAIDRNLNKLSHSHSIDKDGANLSLNIGSTYDVFRQRTDIKGYEIDF
ncbi:hypothetical protein [Vibrio hangzhouensis]|nr:hypothetical protein [Vibrio hangzhouensis]MBY6196131.1 hypothetical protein [Vibrio hangzhouensis]